MQLDQTFGKRQPESRAFLFAPDLAVDLTERRHGLGDVFRRHADAVVADPDGQATAVLERARDANLTAFGGELHGVRQQIDEDLPQPALVGANPSKLVVEGDAEADLRLARLFFDELHAGLYRRREIDLVFLERKASGLQFRQVQNV